tara:strand:- start:25212 stop:25955 length:744 start_codon:yes stop_codon:yes gene_type:complete
MNNTIQSLWVGKEISTIEKLSMASFIHNSNDYHLYAYNEIKDLPDGIKLCDANEILPEKEVFCYQTSIGKGSFSAFSNYFRYKLLYEKGGFWADTDNICLKKFDFTEDYVFGLEFAQRHNNLLIAPHAASALFKAPKNSAIMIDNYNHCLSKDKNTLIWGEVGPTLIQKSIEKFNLSNHLKSATFFNPIGYNEVNYFISNNSSRIIDLEQSYSVHLWNECWRQNGLDKNKSYHPSSIFEKLKKKYLQ